MFTIDNAAKYACPAAKSVTNAAQLPFHYFFQLPKNKCLILPTSNPHGTLKRRGSLLKQAGVIKNGPQSKWDCYMEVTPFFNQKTKQALERRTFCAVVVEPFAHLNISSTIELSRLCSKLAVKRAVDPKKSRTHLEKAS
jgi:hypothetical protein